ncbi:MAG: 23S rRNA (uracil(1939)-C(5))-methyltransferase RlmD [Paludibacteraceae bacterium]
MPRKKKFLPVFENVTITDIAAEGKAIAKTNDIVTFIPYAVPGDIVDVQITRKKSHFMEGRVVKFHQYSDVRQQAFCQHFGICGGCKWQILPYAEQLRFKQNEVENNLHRIGKIKLPPITPILASKKTEFYRNKLEFTFSNKRWLTLDEINSEKEYATMNAVGFHIPGMFDKVLDIEKCWLQDDIQNQIRNEIRDYALLHNLIFFDLRNQEGFLRTMLVRTTSTGELMVIIVFYKEDKEQRELLLQHISDTFPAITSLLYVINSKGNDTITDQVVHTFKGNDVIVEEMEGLKFRIGAKSFYQTNSAQAYELYKIARDFSQLTGNEVVYDLYTGTGTIANFVARHSQKVIGIEYVPEAVEDAKTNSLINNIENTLFFAGDMKDILNEIFIQKHGKPDVIITDPPRAGMHQDVIDAMLFADPDRIVYVSCNSATQARDLAILDEKYEVKAVQPVDMFPHTHHVENVVLLEKRS